MRHESHRGYRGNLCHGLGGGGAHAAGGAAARRRLALAAAGAALLQGGRRRRRVGPRPLRGVRLQQLLQASKGCMLGFG